jgi:hypothetical protein
MPSHRFAVKIAELDDVNRIRPLHADRATTPLPHGADFLPVILVTQDLDSLLAREAFR